MSGTAVKTQAEIKLVTPEGVYLVIEDVGYFASFDDFPYLAALPSGQILYGTYITTQSL